MQCCDLAPLTPTPDSTGLKRAASIVRTILRTRGRGVKKNPCCSADSCSECTSVKCTGRTGSLEELRGIFNIVHVLPPTNFSGPNGADKPRAGMLNHPRGLEEFSRAAILCCQPAGGKGHADP